MTNAINWFEIPVTDMNRAAKFYGSILDTTLESMEFQGVPHTCLPYGEGGVGGALVANQSMNPTREGALIYLNGGEDLSLILNRVTDAGGKIETPKVQINEQIGYMAVFEDSEGNRIGLHSHQ